MTVTFREKALAVAAMMAMVIGSAWTVVAAAGTAGSASAEEPPAEPPKPPAKLFAVCLGGGSEPDRLVEDHELVFVLAEDAKSAGKKAAKLWRGRGGGHADTSTELAEVNGHKIGLEKRDPAARAEDKPGPSAGLYVVMLARKQEKGRLGLDLRTILTVAEDAAGAEKAALGEVEKKHGAGFRAELSQRIDSVEDCRIVAARSQ